MTNSTPVIPKDWWRSKTVWLGIITILIAVGQYVATWIQQHPQFTVSDIILFVVGILIIVMRFLTNTPIGTPPAA